MARLPGQKSVQRLPCKDFRANVGTKESGSNPSEAYRCKRFQTKSRVKLHRACVIRLRTKRITSLEFIEDGLEFFSGRRCVRSSYARLLSSNTQREKNSHCLWRSCTKGKTCLWLPTVFFVRSGRCDQFAKIFSNPFELGPSEEGRNFLDADAVLVDK